MSSGATTTGGGRPQAAAADRRIAFVSAVAGASGLAVLACGALPWYRVESPVRIGATVAVTDSLWSDPRGDLAVALLLAAGVALSALTVAIRMTARATPSAWFVSAGATAAFLIALLIVIDRVGDPPGEAGTRYGAVLALVLAVVATAASALAARLGRPSVSAAAPRSGARPARPRRRS